MTQIIEILRDVRVEPKDPELSSEELRDLLLEDFFDAISLTRRAIRAASPDEPDWSPLFRIMREVMEDWNFSSKELSLT